MTLRVRAYECTVSGTTWHSTVHAETAGKAKSEYRRNLRDAWPEIPYTAMQCRLAGPPVTSDTFRSVAEYRGVPWARVGMQVRMGSRTGVLVGVNDSCNFEVLFEGGQRGACHPGDLVFPDAPQAAMQPLEAPP